MNRHLIETASGLWKNSVRLPDGWTGAPGEWQVPAGHELIDAPGGGTGHVWDGEQFIAPAPPDPPERPLADVLAELLVEKNVATQAEIDDKRGRAARP